MRGDDSIPLVGSRTTRFELGAVAAPNEIPTLFDAERA